MDDQRSSDVFTVMVTTLILAALFVSCQPEPNPNNRCFTVGYPEAGSYEVICEEPIP